MAAGSIGSRILTIASLIAVTGAVGGLYAMALKGDRPQVQTVTRETPSAAESTTLDRADVTSASRLGQTFDRMGYHLDAIRDGRAEVPPLFLAQVPVDLDDLADADTRKTVFLKVMLPLVLAVDEEIAGDRARLLDLAGRKATHQPISGGDQAWLNALADRYGVEDGNLKKLIVRVDVVPPSLALAQSAEESGWGTSRLVRRSRNLFGHTVEVAGSEPGMRHFGSLYEAVRAYVHNLNTHRAYEDLRRARATARAHGQAPDGHTLVAALSRYSERGDAYVTTIRSLMRRNDLGRFDNARLGRNLPGRYASAS
jgi:Bax protein